MQNMDKTKIELIEELDNLHQKIVSSASNIEKEIDRFNQITAILTENEMKFRTVLENSIAASYKRDLKTNTYEYLSPVFTKITGYTVDEMKVMPIGSVFNLIHPDDLLEIEKVFIKSIEPPFGIFHKIEYRFKNKLNGEYQWLVDQYTVILNAEGKPESIIGSVGEITESKQFEQKLVESNERLLDIFNNMQDAYFEADSTGKFTMVNPMALKMYGLTAEDVIIGEPATSLYADPADRDHLKNLLSKEGHVTDFICRGLRKDQSTFWVSMNVNIKYEKKGEFAGTVGVVRDITERI